MPRLREGLTHFRRDLQREWKFIMGTFAASGVGYLGSAAAPVIVQALIEAGLNYEQAGNLGTIELLMLALTSTLVMPYVTRVSHRKMALGGALLAALGLVISVLSVSHPAMVIGRVIIGIGSGVAISAANAAVAAREDAERIFAIIWTMGGGITASIAINMPGYVQGGNYSLGFAILLFLCLAGIPLMIWIPPRPVSLGSQADARSAAASAPSDQPAGLRTVFGPLALMALTGMFIYSAAEQALWQFAYNIPIESGIPEDSVRWILGFTTLMGLAGGAVAAALGVRLGRVAPLVVGSLLSVFGRWMYIATSGSEWLFVGGLMWGLGFYFVSPYQIGLAAALDRQGRVAVAAGAAFNFGYAVGPTIGGRILQHLDQTSLILAVAGATLASMLLMLPLAIRVDRNPPRQPAELRSEPAPR